MEKMFFGGRRTGKTIELIKRSAETKIPIMVANAHRADALMHQADQMGYKIPHPITVNHVMKRQDGLRGSIMLDDAEDILEQIFCHHFQIDSMSVSCESWKWTGGASNVKDSM